MGAGGTQMMTHPTLRHMVSQVNQRERHAVAAAARRVPRSQPVLLARMMASLRTLRQPVSTPTARVNSGAALQSVSKAGA